MKFATKVVRAKQLRLTLCPYQAADGRTFVRICQGPVELADLDDDEVATWLAKRADENRQTGTSLETRRPPVTAAENA